MLETARFRAQDWTDDHDHEARQTDGQARASAERTGPVVRAIKRKDQSRRRHRRTELIHRRLGNCPAKLFDYSAEIKRIKPLAGRSCTRNVREGLVPSPTACAALYPLLTAPSIVAGHPVAVQSPARKILGHGEGDPGRWESEPGSAE